jgi:hypothetical protein
LVHDCGEEEPRRLEKYWRVRKKKPPIPGQFRPERREKYRGTTLAGFKAD